MGVVVVVIIVVAVAVVGTVFLLAVVLVNIIWLRFRGEVVSGCAMWRLLGLDNGKCLTCGDNGILTFWFEMGPSRPRLPPPPPPPPPPPL